MPASSKGSMELSAAEMPSTPTTVALVEVEDIGEVDPLLRTGSFAATVSQPPHDADDESVEIELTAEQIEALLTGANPTL